MRDTSHLKTILAPSIEAMGYELWGFLYIPQGHHGILRIYIDHFRGITVADCEKVSRQVSAVLDVEDPIAGAYTLEVSSPGICRPLFTIAQFERFKGHRADVRVHNLVEGRRHLKGVIEQATEDEVLLKTDEKQYGIKLNNIARANLISSA